GRLVDPGEVLELVTSALREASGGEIRFLQNQPLIDALDRPPAVLLAAARDRAEPFWSAEHHPELPSSLSGWMTAERVALVIPVRRDEMLFGFVVVSGVAALPRARTMLCVRLCEHLALKLQNFVLYADAALAARELADYRAFLENLVESLPVGVATVAPDLKVRSWNRAMEVHTGVDRARALASGCFDQLFPHLQRDLTARDAIAATQRDPSSVIAQVAVSTPGPQGVQYHDLLFAAFRDSHGEPRGAVVISDDVTQRVRLAEELEESRRLASLGAFAAALAHDIRTPLTSIQMNVQILSSRVELGESDREYLDIAQEEISRLTRSVGEILEYARPLALNYAAEDMGDFVDDLARSVATLYAERGVRVEVARELDGECVIPVDLARLRRAVLNLLDNAVDASPRDAAVTLRVRSDAGSVRLSVEDRGRGIPAEALSRVFDPFFTTRPDGTGLGLAIARNIVRAHGGQLDVASEPERGTTFTVTLPRARAEQAPSRPRLSDPFGPKPDDATPGEPPAR
ncbi:MAG: ATP-binding protein, partial [Polyangiales bacterium]